MPIGLAMNYRRLVRLASVASVLLAASPALAQSQGSPNVSVATASPSRFLYLDGVCGSCAATDVTSSPRPQDRNPQGVSFSDCEQNLRLDFSLVLSGLPASDSDSVQVWAGTVDCAQDTNRAGTAGAAHPCWQVARGTGPILQASPQTVPVSVYARDLLRYAGADASPTSQPYDPAFNSSALGESACHTQATDAAVNLSLYFIAVSPTGNAAAGTAYQYALQTDLVGPPPPCDVTAQGGSNVLTVTWNAPAGDDDRVGFGVWKAVAGEAGCDSPDFTAHLWTLPPSKAACGPAGVSQITPKDLAGTLAGPDATSFTQTGVEGGVRMGAVVASLDGSGNFGPPSMAACAAVGGSANGSPSTATAGCGCTGAGAPAGSGMAWVALAALTVATRRRRS